MSRKNDPDGIEQCSHTGKCGGCSHTGIPYEEQLNAKQERIDKLFRSSGCRVERILGADSPFHYRNKVHSVFSRDKKGNIIRGMYAQDSHDVIGISHCLLEDKTADAIIEEIRKIASKYKMRIYDEDSRTGFLRHVLVRVAQYHGEKRYMVVIVTSQVDFEGKNNFVKLLKKAFPAIDTIIQNINNKRTSMILGERNIVISGKGYIIDDSLGFGFRISPSAFFQINPQQTRKLYNAAMELASPSPDDNILDAYCGTGTIGTFMSRKAGHVTGVELNPDAVKDALSNAKRNRIENISFICSDATEYLKELAIKAGETDHEKTGHDRNDRKKELLIPDILCMDPPRSGATPEFINAAAELGIKRIVYISCNPDTLIRDIDLFKKKGYKVERAVPVDMFPHTDHIEMAVKLSK